MTPVAWAKAWVLSAVASSRWAAFRPATSRSARLTPGRGRGRYSIHRRAASSSNAHRAWSAVSPDRPDSRSVARRRMSSGMASMPSVLPGRRGEDPGKVGRPGHHGPVAGVDVDEVDLLGPGELGQVTVLDPLPGLSRGELGAHEHDRYVEPSLVGQPHLAPDHP